MQDLKELKQKIYDDEDIETLLVALECEYISKEQNGELFTAQLPSRFDSNNRRSVQVKNTPSLMSYVRSKGISGDIFFLVGFILYDITEFNDVVDNLGKIKQWICETLGYTEFLQPSYIRKAKNKPEKRDWNKWLKNLRKKRGADTSHMTSNDVIDEKVLERYDICPNEWWLKEGISIATQLEFQVGFDIFSKRIIFPVHDANGQLIGVKGRYVGKNKDILDHTKYIYLEKCNKSLELFNWHRALPYIKHSKTVYVVEAAKTVMLAWTNKVKNIVSIEGDELSPAQAQMLKDLGMEYEIIFAFDKDKEGDFVRKQLSQFSQVYRVSYLMDDENLLKNKESPFDKGIEVWYHLLVNKYNNK